jgi:hypothetical protein
VSNPFRQESAERRLLRRIQRDLDLETMTLDAADAGTERSRYDAT